MGAYRGLSPKLGADLWALTGGTRLIPPNFLGVVRRLFRAHTDHILRHASNLNCKHAKDSSVKSINARPRNPTSILAYTILIRWALKTDSAHPRGSAWEPTCCESK